MIDISDGVVLDLSRVATASRCGAQIDRALLERVIHPDCRESAKISGKSAILHALEDGEDYELIVAMRPDIAAVAETELGDALSRIGIAVAEGGVFLMGPGSSREALAIRGWEHPIGQ
jgi:thiamine-monophosphate kinase